jgi:hypothetical protein
VTAGTEEETTAFLEALRAGLADAAPPDPDDGRMSA